MESAEKTASAGVALSLVLASTRAGREELARPQAGLSLTQRKLLSRLDGQRRLADLVGADAGMSAERIARDALRLLMLGLARSDDFPDTQPRPTTVVGVTPTTHVRAPATDAPPPPAPVPTAPTYTRRRLPIVAGIVVAGAVALAASFFLRSSPRAAAAVAAQVDSPAPVRAAPALVSVAKPETPRPALAAAPVALPPAPAANPPPARVPSTSPPKPDPHAAAPAPTIPAVAKHERQAAAAAPAPKSAVVHEVPATPRPANVETARTGTVLQLRGANRDATPAAPAQPAPPASGSATTLAVAPVVSTAPPADAGPRPLLPVEREFAPAESDPQRLALAAAGRAPVQRTPPIFPREALRQGVTEGSVRARLFIAADGTVERVETSVADPRFAVFEHSARVALMTWLFMPGEAGRVHDTVVNFRAP